MRSKFTKLGLDYDAKIIANLTGWIDADATLNLDLYIRQLITSSRTTVTVKYRVEDSLKYLTLLNYDIDTCKTLKELMQAGLVKVWFRNIRKYGNLSANCPIKPGYYNLRNLQLDSSSIPVFLRTGDYRIRVFNYNGNAKPNANQNPELYSHNKAKMRRGVTCITVDMKLY
ncbi:hypothetical protein KR093_010612 [Drosophila rubida]|uniref:Uncharacterized protein n=1 Tax=Drosophila rubida TaxID=30044 RepID=A0AAD4KB08_9MUSC|nr:hypothetical protein KR093_010612 [Drosophila rubida]